jgi:ubiquinone/menaquinone biosynthesis C-methylase UbiE
VAVSFDWIAPHYCWLETLVFGRQLQAARMAFVKEMREPDRVLVVGEGDGRFLAEFVRAHPRSGVDCIDASGRMIELARQRVGTASVNFVQGDVREVELPVATYDLVVTHFFLDCLSEQSLFLVIAKLARSAKPDARWLIADFCEPERNGRRMGPRFLIALMYFFFRVVSGIEARRLIDYRPFLRVEGFSLVRTILSPNKMVRSEVWGRGSSG